MISFTAELAENAENDYIFIKSSRILPLLALRSRTQRAVNSCLNNIDLISKYTITILILFLSPILCSGFTSKNIYSSKTFSDPAKVFQKKAGKDNSIRWFLQTHSSKSRGVALAIHGLNLHPAKMEAIILGLNTSGIDVLNVSLFGHGENYTRRENMDSAAARLESFKNASYQLWIAECYQAYIRAQKKSRQSGVPLYFVGFSFGGLLGLDLLVSNPKVRFEKMVLFAPAIDVHAINYVVKILSPFPKLVIPSYSFKSYRANNGTPVAAYIAFFDSLANFKKNVGPKFDIPTLVFIDKRDELVSYQGIKEMVSAESFSQWKIHLVKKQKTSGPAKRHHLIIDADSTGTAVWEKMMTLMVKHFID
jgi:esterase/lipase